MGTGDESEYDTARVAEALRALLARAAVLLAVLLAAPHLYGALVGGSLGGLAGADPLLWETVQWALAVATVFAVLCLVGVAKCTGGT